jgi:cell division protein FtsL
MSQSERKAVVELDKKLKVLVGYDSERIYTRAEWGSILSFEPFRQDFERSFGLARIFSDLPYHLLPDAQLNTIGIAVETASTHFAQIDSFDSATANNPQNLVKTLGNTVKTHADVITVEMAQWISYLAYQKGDVSQNISMLEKAISKGEGIISAAKERIETEEGQMKKIIQQAQDFAGDKGVTIFTEQFNSSAQENKDEATLWIKITTGIFSLTVVLIVVFMYQLIGVSEWYEWASRATLVGVLITGGLWCGKTYRILRHQQTVNQHKANSLKSFLLFRDAADNDEVTRNAVLMETTKSIFSSASSGFISETGNQRESGVQIIETSRVASTLASATRAEKTGAFAE